MSADTAIESVREAFQGRRGKILMLGGGAAVAAYVIYTRRTGTPEPVPGEDLTAVPANASRTPQTDPPVGNDTQGSITPRRPTSNAEWLTAGVDILIGRGTPGANAHDALTKALGGQQLTTQQTAWVSQVIGAIGSPPEGMPPLNAAPPPGNPQTPPPTGGGGGGSKPPTTARPGRAHVHHVLTTRTSATVQWYACPGATGYVAYMTGPKSRTLGGTARSTTWTGLTPGRTYSFSVAGTNKAGRGPLSNVITVKTKS